MVSVLSLLRLWIGVWGKSFQKAAMMEKEWWFLNSGTLRLSGTAPLVCPGPGDMIPFSLPVYSESLQRQELI